MATTRLLSALLAWLAMLAAPACTWWLAVRTWQWGGDTGWAPATIEEAVMLAAAGLGCAVTAYLSVSTVAILAAQVSGRSRSWMLSLTPAVWRRLVATAVSAGMATGIAAPAMAADADTDHVDTSPAHAGWVDTPADAAVTTSEVDLAPSPSPWPSASPSPSAVASATLDAPESTAGAPPPSPAPSAAPQSADVTSVAEDRDDGAHGETYTVERGDSLWRITARVLGDGADDSQIAASWPLLYRANEGVIGDNPSLIHPGQELTIPQELVS